MNGDFDEDEDPDFEPEWEVGEEDMCAVCQRFGSYCEICSIYCASMCPACFEMGCGVCKGPHRR